MRDTDPRRIAFYLTSRGLTNEVYYAAQKAARFIGTNNIDNAARVCHSPSTVGLKQSVGVGAYGYAPYYAPGYVCDYRNHRQ